MGRILRGRPPWTGLIASLVLMAVLVTLMGPFRIQIGPLNAALLFLLASLLVAATWGRMVG